MSGSNCYPVVIIDGQLFCFKVVQKISLRSKKYFMKNQPQVNLKI
jgi:hypothetical protein